MNGGVERCPNETRTLGDAQSALAELRTLRASTSRLRLYLFTAIALGALVALALASVVYVENTSRLFNDLRQDSLQNETFQTYLDRSANFTDHLKGVTSKFQSDLGAAEETIHRQQLEIQQYKSAIHHRRTVFKLAIDKMKKGDASDPDVVLAWQRMETALKTHETDQNSDIAQSMKIDEELANALEVLSNRLHQKSSEKDELEQTYKHLLEHSKGTASALGILQFRHFQIAELYHPLLSYVQTLEARLDHRASAMLGLTTLVHSLNEALRLSHAELEEQKQDSSAALDEVALAAKDFSLASAEAYEMERRHYVEYMNMRLDRQEDEAVGAVHAVATAAGKLEYERKMEEVARWKSYTAETEQILASVKKNVHEAALEDIANDRSVLKAAISRRIEEGVASLKSYIHPYSYIRDRSHYGERINIGSPKADDEGK